MVGLNHTVVLPRPVDSAFVIAVFTGFSTCVI